MQLYFGAAFRHGEDWSDANQIVCAANPERAYELFYEWFTEVFEESEEDALARYERVEIFRIPPLRRTEGCIDWHEPWPDGCQLVKEVNL